MTLGDTSPFDPSEVNQFARRIGSLGSSVERFFTRIHNSLTQNAELERQKEQARKIAQRNEQLLAFAAQRDQELERLNGIIATIDQGIILQDLDGRVVLINPAAKEMIGGQKAFRESGLGGLFDAYKDIVHVDSELTPLGEPTRQEINNRIIGTTLAAVANSDGERIGTLIVLRDVTREALGDRLKDQFDTAISHELRTPMNVIKMGSEVLLAAPEGTPANRNMLERIGRNVDVLDRMIVEVLDISEMSTGSFQIRQEDVDVETLVWNIINGMIPEVKAAKLDVAVMNQETSGLHIVGDQQRLRWALGHLLRNSINYTEAGTIFFGLSKNDDGHVAIQVIDTGVGISDKDLPHIFERFYRGEPRTPDGKLLDPRGLGQGLFVARTVAEAHGGYLSVRTEVGAGSVFTMVLPIAPQRTP